MTDDRRPSPAEWPDDAPRLIFDTSDDALATRFVKSNRGKVRFVSLWNRWFHWNGKRWHMDDRLIINKKIRDFLRNIADRTPQALALKALKARSANSAKSDPEMERTIRAGASHKYETLKSATRITRVKSIVSCDGEVASSVTDWDADPWLLGTPDGTLDLRTGNMKTPRAADYITKSTAIAPTARKQPTLWLNLLETSFQGDQQLITYLQKVFGYCLVGETREHEMYFAFGTGRNGKGTIINTVRRLMGDYGMTGTIETFMRSSETQHPTNLADLRGARLVICGEVDHGQQWNEARIKMLTGGDPIKARFMRQDFFEFQPQFKLFLAGNHKPRLSHVDVAIERRFRLIPFSYTLPEEMRDTKLSDKLVKEWPAVLHWCVEGALRWQTEGLQPPASVESATRQYLSSEDALTAWITDCCTLEPEAFAPAQDLYRSWAEWCASNSETAGGPRTFTRSLADREPILNIERCKRQNQHGFRGIRLLH